MEIRQILSCGIIGSVGRCMGGLNISVSRSLSPMPGKRGVNVIVGPEYDDGGPSDMINLLF